MALRGVPIQICKGRRTITRRAHSSRLPRTQAEHAAPLHVADVGALDVDGLTARLHPKARTRFREVWERTFLPSLLDEPVAPPIRIPPSTLTPQQALRLCEAGVVEAGAGPGYGNVAFTVLEEKAGALRQRYILWTAEANAAQERDGYAAYVPLGHVSKYLSPVREECGSGRDLRTSFFQVPIPKDSRRYFRFLDTAGNSWEMTRLPMGHTCSVELMHTLVSALAGHPAYVQDEFAETRVRVDSWVDNIRYTGQRQDVLDATALLDARAQEFGVTWKDGDSFTGASSYTYVGVDFDHRRNSVCPSGKVSSRITAFLGSLRGDGPHTVPAAEIEAMAGRLLHASAIAGVSPGEFYFTLKFIRRIINSLNRCIISPTDRVALTGGTVRGLREWAAAALKERIILADPPRPTFAVFVDASKQGWGAVVVNEATAELKILGETWTAAERQQHINVLEAWALSEGARALPAEACDTRVRFLVDNTTVVHCSRKGVCMKNHAINDAVIFTLSLLKRSRITFTIAYIRSALNPSDLPSRVRLTDFSSADTRSVVGLVKQFFGG
jgi:hypothetical protein